MLAAAAGRDVGDRSLEDLQKRLLDAFAGNIARDRRVVVLAADLVDLVDIDNSLLGLFDVAAGGLQKPEQNILNIFADITGLGQARRIDDAERNAQDPRKRLRKQRFAGPGRADKQDIRFLQLDVAIGVWQAQAACNADKPRPKAAFSTRPGR